jgi:hypothetical protein
LTLVFFTDRDLGTAFPEILKRAGLAVERHRDHFPPDCSDQEWLAEVGKRDWVARVTSEVAGYERGASPTGRSALVSPRWRSEAESRPPRHSLAKD